MNPTNLIIEDFDFLQYPLIRTYQLGGKTVIQIGEPLSEKPKKSLFDEIDNLKHDCKVFEEEKESAELELEKAEKELDELEEKHNKELDKIEDSLESAEQFLGIKTSERLIHHRICEFARKIDETFQSEKVSGLEIDNRALCNTIECQDATIAELTEKLTRWETAYPHG